MLRIVQSRSPESILKEARLLTKLPNFKGYIHDVGGPTANFRFPSCKKQLKVGTCKNRQCLAPEPCPNLEVDEKELTRLLRDLRQIPGVKKVFIRSGLRFDYMMLDKSDEFFNELCAHHVSGQLKVAPEHVAPKVLKLMGKPRCEVFKAFCESMRASTSAWEGPVPRALLYLQPPGLRPERGHRACGVPSRHRPPA